VYFARHTLDPEAALDLAGETFALALEKRAQFRGGTPREERGWLSAIAHSRLVLFWRRGEVERAALQRPGVEVPDGSTADVEWVERAADLPSLRATVRTALGDLPQDQAYRVQRQALRRAWR